jgi:ribonuclease P protein component
VKEPRSLTNRAQYTLVYRQGEVWTTSLLVMKAMPNDLSLSRYGFSVTKKVGNAVQRNHLKRLLREIMRLQSLRPGWDIVFIARSTAVNADYHQLEQAVTKLLTGAKLLENNEWVN